jgi:PTH1 family peptidyl-tRNA hydrolase
VYAVLGLGNPGAEYDGTRHNVGFAVVEELARRWSVDLTRVRHRARFGTGRIGAAPVLLALPQTYMNLSGEAARPLLAYHGIDPASLVVVHDEADFEPGVVRLKRGGGTAGHKGLISLVAHLAGPDFVRVRIGIGRPPGGPEKLAKYVLERPGKADGELLQLGVQRGASAVEILLRDGLEAALREVHRPDP